MDLKIASLCCVVAPMIMERRETPVLFLGSGNLVYTYPVVSYYENVIVAFQLLCCMYML